MKIQTSTIDFQPNFSNCETSSGESSGSTPKRLYYKTVADHLCCDLNGETVILSLENGKYHGINEVGSRIWQMLENFVSLPEIEQTLLEEYEVAEEVCRQEIAAFLNLMIEEGLIETSYESFAANS